jgi:hypothetical protein
MSRTKGGLPRGSSVVCLDAMILIGYADADLIDVLGTLFATEGVDACTSAWLYENEIEQPATKYPNNKRILSAGWLKTAPVHDEDIVYVQNLLDAWGSELGRDRGEAEVVALCTRHGWTGVTDDGMAHGVPELHAQHRPFNPTMVHGAALLAAAAAENLITLEEAWAAHQALEARYDVPPLLPVDDDYAPALSLAVDLIRAKRNSLGQPNWPILLTHDPDRMLRSAVSRRRKELGG